MAVGDVTTVCPGPDPCPRAASRFLTPAGAVDTHAHVVGTTFVSERTYTPPPASGADYLAMLDAVGMTHGVLIQVSGHGTDNSVLLDVLERNPGRLRGIALLEPDVPDRELERCRAAGVVGIRLNSLGNGGIGLAHLDTYERICADMGWHIELIANPGSLADIAARLGRLSVPYVLDHLAHVPVDETPTDPGARLVLALAADGAWIKMSGAYRLSTVPGYGDTVPFARGVVEAAPDRVVWGSDWPHVGFWGRMPNVGGLLDVLADWAPDPETRESILVANAHRLYGFSDASGSEGS